MSTAEVSKVAADQSSKLVKEKKTKAAASKVNKPKSAKTASHPPYFEMIKEALLALKEKGGSSPYAIAKYIEENQKVVLPSNFRKILGLQLKNSAAKGKLIKVKASYKLSDSGKKDKKTAVAKPVAIAKKKKKVEKAVKKTVAAAKGALKMKPKKVDSSAKKAKAGASAQKTKKRAAAPAKVKAKQPKSIKSPAAKKAKKAGA